jgi:type III secretion protein S
MSPTSVLDLTYQALILALLLSLPAVLTAAVVGFVVAALQAVTQIQDQNIGLAAKLISVFVVIVLSARWVGGELLNFGNRLFDTLPALF